MILYLEVAPTGEETTAEEMAAMVVVATVVAVVVAATVEEVAAAMVVAVEAATKVVAEAVAEVVATVEAVEAAEAVVAMTVATVATTIVVEEAAAALAALTNGKQVLAVWTAAGDLAMTVVAIVAASPNNTQLLSPALATLPVVVEATEVASEVVTVVAEIAIVEVQLPILRQTPIQADVVVVEVTISKRQAAKPAVATKLSPGKPTLRSTLETLVSRPKKTPFPQPSLA